MLINALYKAGLRGWMLHASSLGSIALCVLLWQRAKTVDQDERGNAERRALFVGLWPPTFWVIADSIEHHDRRQRHAGADALRSCVRRAIESAGRRRL